MQPLATGYMVSASAVAEGSCGADHKAAEATRPPCEGQGREGKCGMEKMDSDKDGKVSKAEFAAAHDNDDSKFASHDTNSDGFISAEEMKAHMGGSGGAGKMWKKASAAKGSAAPARDRVMACALPQRAGLGLRRALLGALQDAPPGAFDFLECAPENWIGVGGRLGDAIRRARIAHIRSPAMGCRLSLGGPAPLDETFVDRVGAVPRPPRRRAYSEHLSYCSDDGQLYDLMPIPFTDEAVHHVAAASAACRTSSAAASRSRTSPTTRRRIARIDEADFVNAVLDEADCDLLLDVNNVYVNAINHRLRRRARSWPRCRPRASRSTTSPGITTKPTTCKVDTHGAPVKDDVWALLDEAYALLRRAPDAAGARLQLSRRSTCCWRNCRRASARFNAAHA